MLYFLKIFYLGVLLAFMLNCIEGQPTEITTIERNELQTNENFIHKTQNILASPAGQLIVQVSKEFISRSLGNGRALSINLRNLLIIVFLKALIFIAGFISAGSWTIYARGRDARDDYWITENEKNLYMGFLAAELGDFGCLSKAACEAPGLSRQYAHAARALLNGYEKFSGEPIEQMEDYEELIRIVEEGSMRGTRGIACEMYSCRI